MANRQSPGRAASLEDLLSLPPTISVERAGEIIGLSRNSSYAAARAGELPTLSFGRRRVVPTAALLRMLGFDVPTLDPDTVRPDDATIGGTDG